MYSNLSGVVRDVYLDSIGTGIFWVFRRKLGRNEMSSQKTWYKRSEHDIQSQRLVGRIRTDILWSRGNIISKIRFDSLKMVKSYKVVVS